MLAPRLQTSACTSGSRPEAEERLHRSAEQERLHPQRRDAPGALGEDLRAHQRAVAEARQEERVEPEQDAGDEARERAGAGGAAPVEAADQARQELRDAAEGDEADGGERVGAAAEAEVDEAEAEDQRDADPARGEEEPADVAATSRPAVRRRSASGITTWFETMVETAIEATITIEVADEKPPRKARSARSCAALLQRQGQDEEIGVGARRQRASGRRARSA